MALQYAKNYIVDIDDGSIQKIKAKQKDIGSRFLNIKIVGNNIPFNLSNYEVKFYAEKPDKTIIFNNVTVLDAVGGLVQVGLTSQTLAVAGEIRCELSIIETSTQYILGTKIFALIVEESVRNDSAIVSANEVTAWQVKVDEFSQFKLIGTWQASTAYKKYNMVSYNGDIYYALQNNTTNGTPSLIAPNWCKLSSKGDKGDIGLSVSFKGNYNASTAYILSDAVSYNNVLYYAKQSTTGNLPTNTTYWQKAYSVTEFNVTAPTTPTAGDFWYKEV